MIKEDYLLMNQREGFDIVRDGHSEMACYAPDHESESNVSFWRALWEFLTAPRFNA